MQDDEERTCHLCLENPRSLRYAPCGHAVACTPCTLQLIEHSSNMVLKCPSCRAEIEQIEVPPQPEGGEGAAAGVSPPRPPPVPPKSNSRGWRSVVPSSRRAGLSSPAATPPAVAAIAMGPMPIAQQPTFARPGYGLEEGIAPTLLTVPEFFEAQISSSDPERAALAGRAKKAWVEAPPSLFGGLPHASLLLPMPPSRRLRIVTLILSLALACAWIWALAVVAVASREFETYLGAASYDLKVTRHMSFDGPVVGLVPSGRLCSHSGGGGGGDGGGLGGGGSAATITASADSTSVPCINLLPDPTRHQRWWALVPNGEVGRIDQGTAGLSWGRSALFYFVALTNTGTILKPLVSSLANQPTALGELSSAGMTIMVGAAVLISLYGMYWDEQQQVVYVNYVPGEGYAWMVAWMGIMLMLLLLFLTRQRIQHLALLLLAAIYWLFWLSIPLLGFSWFFAWRFVDAIAAQGAETSTHPLPFAESAAQGLGVPFALCVYMGCMACVGGFALSLAQYTRHVHLLGTNAEYRQRVFVEARRDQAAQARAGSALARLLNLLPHPERTPREAHGEAAGDDEDGERGHPGDVEIADDDLPHFPGVVGSERHVDQIESMGEADSEVARGGGSTRGQGGAEGGEGTQRDSSRRRGLLGLPIWTASSRQQGSASTAMV